MQAKSNLILASRSPRRRELLGHLVGTDGFEVIAPANSEEQGFEDCHDLSAITERIGQISIVKCSQVRNALDPSDHRNILSADTIVIATEDDGRPVVLGQPAADGDWRAEVREWFERYYWGKSHLVMTAVSLDRGTPFLGLVSLTQTKVSFRDDAKHLLDWYLSTGDSLGKAGGYGIQGAAGLFVDRVEGSLTNVVGLPLFETRELLSDAGLIGA